MEIAERLGYTLQDFRRNSSYNELRLWAIRDSIRSDEAKKVQMRTELDSEVANDFEKNRGKYTNRRPTRGL